jgi:hypothetical protein
MNLPHGPKHFENTVHLYRYSTVQNRIAAAAKYINALLLKDFNNIFSKVSNTKNNV